MELYENLGTIGEGTYGVVLKCRHKESGQIVAIKKFKESDEDEQVRKTALREVRILKQLRHENIVHLIEVFRRKGRLYLVFEYVERTVLDELEKNPRGLGMDAVKQLLWQLLRAVAFCHAHNVVHRDIKPENLLISRHGVLKVCDFGFARTIADKDARYTDYVSTRWYRSPELLVGDPNYSAKAIDVWATGCLLAEICSGDPLFPGDSDIDQLHQIVRCFGNLNSRHEELFGRNPLFGGIQAPRVRPEDVVALPRRLRQVDDDLLNMMQLALDCDPGTRPSCDELLQHTFFHGFASQFEPMLREAVRRDGRDQVLIKNRRGRRRRHKRGTETENEHERTDRGADSCDAKLSHEADEPMSRPVPSLKGKAPAESKGDTGRAPKAAEEEAVVTTKRGSDRPRHQHSQTLQSPDEGRGEGEGAERHREAKDAGDEKVGVDPAPLTFRSEASDVHPQAPAPPSTQSERRSHFPPLPRHPSRRTRRTETEAAGAAASTRPAGTDPSGGAVVGAAVFDRHAHAEGAESRRRQRRREQRRPPREFKSEGRDTSRDRRHGKSRRSRGEGPAIPTLTASGNLDGFAVVRGQRHAPDEDSARQGAPTATGVQRLVAFPNLATGASSRRPPPLAGSWRRRQPGTMAGNKAVWAGRSDDVNERTNSTEGGLPRVSRLHSMHGRHGGLVPGSSHGRGSQAGIGSGTGAGGQLGLSGGRAVGAGASWQAGSLSRGWDVSSMSPYAVQLSVSGSRHAAGSVRGAPRTRNGRL